MDDAVLAIRSLSKAFGKVQANNAINLTIYPGQIVGLLGHNGAGKTTLVSQIVGLLKPDSGSISVDGVDAIAKPAKARELVSLQAQSQAPLDGLTPQIAIEIGARIRGMSPQGATAEAKRLIERLEMQEWKDQRAYPQGGGLSGGVRRLTAFAMALVAPTPLLILDEPTNDVDASRRRLLWNLVREQADKGAGVLLVTHNVTEAEQVVDDLVILDHGQVIATGSPQALREQQGNYFRLDLTLPTPDHDPTQGDTPLPFTHHRQVVIGRRMYMHISPEHVRAAMDWAEAHHQSGSIDAYAITPVTLEDLYIQITGKDE